MPQAVLPADTIRELIGLRLMLRRAIELSYVAAPVHRSTAAVLLDAVVERATHMVALAKNIALKDRETFPDTLQKVSVALGPTWRPTMLADVRKLHRARNAAQHEGLSPDASLMAGWREATEAYAVSIIMATYAVDLRRVTLTAAIADSELREMIGEAEQALTAGELPKCVELCTGAFDEAFRRWQYLRGPAPIAPNGVHAFAEFAYIANQLSETDRALQVLPFAVDAAEYAWFRALYADRRHVDTDEAERALAFVFTWITGWESFAATWEPDRQDRAAIARRRTRTTATQATLAEVTEWKKSLPEGTWRCKVTLNDVPTDEGWDAWAFAVGECMEDNLGPLAGRLDRDGSIELWVTPETDMMELFSGLQRSLIEAEGRARALIAAAAGRDAESRAQAERFSAEIESIRDQLPAWLTEVRLSCDSHDVSDPSLRLKVGKLRVVVQQYLNSRPDISAIGAEDELIVTPPLEGAELLMLLRELDGIIQLQLQKDAVQAEELSQQEHALRNAAVAAIQALSRKGD